LGACSDRDRGHPHYIEPIEGDLNLLGRFSSQLYPFDELGSINWQHYKTIRRLIDQPGELINWIIYSPSVY
jgi:hypothetical protein